MRRRRSLSTALFTDVAFILLLFFLVFAITSRRFPIPLELPTASQAEEAHQAGIHLYIDSEGTIHTDEHVITLDQITYAESVSVYADESTDFSLVLPILQHLAQVGIEKVQCIVEVP